MNDEALALSLVVPWIPHANKIDLDITFKGGLISEYSINSDGSRIVNHAVCLSSSISIPTVSQNTACDSVFVHDYLRW